MKMRGIRLRVSSLFVGIVALEIISGAIFSLMSMLLNLLIHESAHILVANIRGYTFDEIRLEPYGAKLVGIPHTDTDRALICLAGPVASGIFAIVFFILNRISHIDIFGHLYASSLGLMVYNVLPCYPLDGSGVILGLSRAKYKTSRIICIVGYIVGFIFLLAFLISVVWYEANFMYLISSIFLISNAHSCVESEVVRYARQNLNYLTDI